MLFVFEQALTLTDSTWNQSLDKGDFRVCGLLEAPKTFIKVETTTRNFAHSLAED